MKSGTAAGLAQPGAVPSAEELLARGDAAMISGAYDEGVRCYEQAYRIFLEAGDRLGAVRVATALVRAQESLANWAAARAWEQRGWRILDELGPSVERGYHE